MTMTSYKKYILVKQNANGAVSNVILSSREELLELLIKHKIDIKGDVKGMAYDLPNVLYVCDTYNKDDWMTLAEFIPDSKKLMNILVNNFDRNRVIDLVIDSLALSICSNNYEPEELITTIKFLKRIVK